MQQAETTEVGERTTRIQRITLAVEEAAEATGLSRTRIFNAIRDGELTARKAGRVTLIEAAELARWIRTFPTRGRSPEAA